jgi:uncharacterized protein
MATRPNIIEAIRENDPDTVMEALELDPAAAGARDPSGLSAVLMARYYGRTEILDALLAAVPELDVFEAAAVGRTERVGQLVGEDPGVAQAWSSDGFTALHLASFFGHAEIVDLLLDAGAEVDVPARNPMRVTPLHSAAASGHVGIATRLVERGADVNARQEGGFTPLHSAGQNGDQETARLLLKHGADPGLRTDDGRTAVDFAREGGQEVVVDLLEA